MDTAGLISKVSYLRLNETESTETQKWKLEVKYREYTPHIPVRHLGLLKPNTIMCQPFLYRQFFCFN